MAMKYLLHYYIGISLLLLFTGCTSQEKEEPMAVIGFQAIRMGSTRAELPTGTIVYPTDDEFVTTAFYLPVEKSWPENRGEATTYIPQWPVSHSASTNTWGTTPVAYWPKVGRLTFFSYAPKTLGEKTEFSLNAENGLTLTNWNVTTYPDVDILVADVQANVQGNRTTYLYNGVPTLFRHKLAKVGVKARLDVAPEAGSTDFIVVNKVTLTNIYTTGTYSLDGDDATAERWTVNTGTKESFVYEPAVEDTRLTASEQEIGKAKLMMPQHLLKDGTRPAPSLLVEYTTTNGTDTDTYTKEFEINTLSANTFWEMGHHIVYTLIFGTSDVDIEFDTSAEDWTDGNQDDIQVGV